MVPTKEPLSTVAEEVVIDKEKFEPVVENTDGDFIDDDFGLSIKKEWEHLRQQQLRIEEEVCFIRVLFFRDSVSPSLYLSKVLLIEFLNPHNVNKLRKNVCLNCEDLRKKSIGRTFDKYKDGLTESRK